MESGIVGACPNQLLQAPVPQQCWHSSGTGLQPHGRRRDSLHISPCGSDGPDQHLGNLEQVSNKQKWSAKCTAENAELNHMRMHRIWQDSCCHNQNSWFPASRAGPEADVALHVKEINDS